MNQQNVLCYPTISFFSKKEKKLFIYLFDHARSQLWIFKSSSQHAGSSATACKLSVAAFVGSSSLTRVHPPALGAWSLSHWTTKKVPPPNYSYPHCCQLHAQSLSINTSEHSHPSLSTTGQKIRRHPRVKF